MKEHMQTVINICLAIFITVYIIDNNKLNDKIDTLEAEISNHVGKKGEVITNDLVIGCKDKSIRINSLQKEGKTVLNTKSFLAGYKIVKGDLLS